MNILHVSAECYPVAKVGGLGDVVGALPKFQAQAGHQARVIMPYYLNAFTEANECTVVYAGNLHLGAESIDFEVLQPPAGLLETDLLMVRIPGLLTTDFVYSFDDSKRFLAFSIAVLTWAAAQENLPDVVHCHDHHTGLIPFMMSYCVQFTQFKAVPTVLTIHNAQYQGDFSMDRVHLLPDFPLGHIGLLDWNGRINPLASAIKCAWRVTTVSPGYMEEMMEDAGGLEGLIRHEHAKCSGIINGVDFDVWDPETDASLPQNFVTSRVKSGKQKNKKILCERFGIDPLLPLFIFIGRLVYEKGSDILAAALDSILIDEEAAVIVLGSGDKATEAALTGLADRFPGKYNVFIGYNEGLAHLMYAGGDFLLMPSRVEPCGLNQLYAMRYGTIPVVRSVGGLKDTVIDVSEGGYGIRHAECTVEQISNAVKRALSLWQDQKEIAKIRKRIMKLDNSWENSSEKYIKLYQSIIVNP